MPKIAFIGAGRMASAIVDGLLAQNSERRAQISCYSASGKSAVALSQRTGIQYAADLPELLDGADCVVVAFKPQHLATADSRLAELTTGKIVLSVLAAKTIAHLEAVFPQARAVVRTMPNTPSAIGAGITGWCTREPLPDTDRSIVTELLGAVGQAIEVPEEKIDALMGVSGCGPAFVFEFTAALRDGGVAAGLTEEEASTLAQETVLGAARLMARSELTPEQLRDQVTSPNGTTYAGLQRMSAHNIRDIMRETVLAAKTRSEELARGD
ncbi:pyrroline-5-carboxylate reductase [Actomonas aquatica]|uniref:Pyrroline-5-carboxylate reductase n=1 Tax=Actomonas aquatica TaxID=2866162 RepID=A0ABZ1CC07_9BACT|nr:pyrroline-5-carboxylate reductase [Opitutus sp. WL0086]WRQ88967.1 pyrroline-5-carboxylate reductase [Opitutus sp. WL0086]